MDHTDTCKLLGCHVWNLRMTVESNLQTLDSHLAVKTVMLYREYFFTTNTIKQLVNFAHRNNLLLLSQFALILAI